MRKEEFCIMPDNAPLWYNKRINSNVVRHEVFFGLRNRQKSIDDGLVVFLTPELHNMSSKGVHFNKEFNNELKRVGEQVWLNYYGKTIEDFIKRYGKNYLN